MWTVLKIAWLLKSRFCKMLWAREQERRLEQMEGTGEADKVINLQTRDSYHHQKHLARTEQMRTNHPSVLQTHQHHQISQVVLFRAFSPDNSINAFQEAKEMA